MPSFLEHGTLTPLPVASWHVSNMSHFSTEHVLARQCLDSLALFFPLRHDLRVPSSPPIWWRWTSLVSACWTGGSSRWDPLDSWPSPPPRYEPTTPLTLVPEDGGPLPPGWSPEPRRSHSVLTQGEQYCTNPLCCHSSLRSREVFVFFKVVMIGHNPLNPPRDIVVFREHWYPKKRCVWFLNYICDFFFYCTQPLQCVAILWCSSRHCCLYTDKIKWIIVLMCLLILLKIHSTLVLIAYYYNSSSM